MKKDKTGTLEIKLKKILGYGIWALAGIFLITTIKNINRVLNINKQVEEEKQRIEKMQVENAELSMHVAETQGSEFIEKQIRDKLGYAKTGETVVIMPDEKIIRKLAPSPTTFEDTLPDPNWIKWRKLFF